MDGITLAEKREEALYCRACPLWADATQTVFGEGPVGATAMFVGEQPGDQEDRQGRPFVGPAGQLFDRALMEAGIDRAQVYVTNAVKHFKFELRGSRRIHQKPAYKEVLACRPWLEAELEIVAPRLVVALGSTAAQALKGHTVTIGKERGRWQDHSGGRRLLVTVHPSYLLRLPDERAKVDEYRRFVDELRLVADALNGEPAQPSARNRHKPADKGGQFSLF